MSALLDAVPPLALSLVSCPLELLLQRQRLPCFALSPNRFNWKISTLCNERTPLPYHHLATSDAHSSIIGGARLSPVIPPSLCGALSRRRR
ncbi:hypothetical protein BaRGS_00021907, partial [Batillaria attramentaria]